MQVEWLLQKSPWRLNRVQLVVSGVILIRGSRNGIRYVNTVRECQNGARRCMTVGGVHLEETYTCPYRRHIRGRILPSVAVDAKTNMFDQVGHDEIGKGVST